MSATPTPHNAAVEGQIAKTVLMPGDPLRAKLLAEKYLENVEQFNTVRNMFGYTGTYQGHPISVMGSGMGMPSIGIYSYELFNFYDVDNIIRIGSAGGLADGVKLRDIVVGMGACTDSNYAAQFNLPGTYAPIADYDLLRRAVSGAEKLGYPVRVGNVLSSDTFYGADETALSRWASMGVLAVEMEGAAIAQAAHAAGRPFMVIRAMSDTADHAANISFDEFIVQAGERSAQTLITFLKRLV